MEIFDSQEYVDTEIYIPNWLSNGLLTAETDLATKGTFISSAFISVDELPQLEASDVMAILATPPPPPPATGI